MSEIYKSPRRRPLTAQNIGEIRLKSNMSHDDFCDMVEKAKEYIKQGEIIQVVPSQRFSTDAPIDPIAAYRALRLINPSPYMFCLKLGEKYLVGSSPETLLRFCDGQGARPPDCGHAPQRLGRKRGHAPCLRIALERKGTRRAPHAR